MLLFPIAVVRALLSAVPLLLAWILMKIALIGAPATSPFEPWRERLARMSVRVLGKLMLVLGAARESETSLSCMF